MFPPGGGGSSPPRASEAPRTPAEIAEQIARESAAVAAKVKAFQAKMAAGNVSPPSEPISPDAARGSGDIRDFFGKAPEASPEATNDAAEAETE